MLIPRLVTGLALRMLLLGQLAVPRMAQLVVIRAQVALLRRRS